MCETHSGSVLGRCSYNRINDVYACENNQTLNTEVCECCGTVRLCSVSLF